MDFLTLLVLILIVLYIGFIVFERVYHAHLRKKFKLIVHVNGIRGKSTTTRLIDAGFRNCGYKVFSKTTGTIPTYIDTNNIDHKVRRLGSANIREQLKMLRLAAKEGAEIVVLECMAVNPELQKICEEKILKADITVITNVRLDHIQEMGENLDEIAAAFAGTIPTNGKLIIGDGHYVKFFTDKAKYKQTNTFVAKPYTGDNLDTVEENISLALAVAESLSEECNGIVIDKDIFFEGMKNYHHDAGAFDGYKYQDTIFLNGLSINDPTSIRIMYDRILTKYDADKITILLNSRFDRPTRVVQHIELLKSMKMKKIILMGSNLKYIDKKIKATIPDIEIEFYDGIDSLLGEEIIFAIGNIGGHGFKVFDFFKENGDKV